MSVEASNFGGSTLINYNMGKTDSNISYLTYKVQA